MNHRAVRVYVGIRAISERVMRCSADYHQGVQSVGQEAARVEEPSAALTESLLVKQILLCINYCPCRACNEESGTMSCPDYYNDLTKM